MNHRMDRTLTILAGGEPVTGFDRARLTGSEQMGLYPSLFLLRLWNVAEEDYLQLSRCKEVTVRLGEVVLISGTVPDVYRQMTKSGTETQIAVSPGLPLWNAPVSLSAEAGVTVKETVQRLLEASGTGVPLLSFPGEDPSFSRGQAFFGRAAECIETALSAAGARACLVPSGLCVVPAGGLPVSVTLTEEDLTDAPAFASDGQMVLRTVPAGWTVGKTIEAVYGGSVNRGVIAERLLDLDTGNGPWRAELLVKIQNSEFRIQNEM